MARPWTTHEKNQLVEMDKIGLPYHDIARVLFRSVLAVESQATLCRRELDYESVRRPGANYRYDRVPAPTEVVYAAPEAHSPEAVIARCTRDGRVLWQHVAQQLGGSIDTVRSRYDASYRREAA
ncbi:hypothetical protein [Phenylobacterium immobile]|uniref:hypothetical protein n=1 Tax=Phenylobacterium immobile TaxID=21 RepID=UPI000AF2D099|nr:hypothetical protein [Phenylobacterium immobile]